MTRSTGRPNDKMVAEWFSNLDFKKQSAVLGSLTQIHDDVRRERVQALRRELDELEGAVTEPKRARAGRARILRNGRVTAKYRDPKTGETWSGRGRMARWLAEKVKAGDKTDKYLV